MAGKLFNKSVIKSCYWCKHGSKSEYTDEVYCEKHGITNKHDHCRHYKYDVLKRTPERVMPDNDFSDKDFSL